MIWRIAWQYSLKNGIQPVSVQNFGGMDGITDRILHIEIRGKKMQRWKAHYKDSLHDINIEIVNAAEDDTEEPLSFTVDEVTFQGSSLGDFHLAKEAQYDEARKRFCLLKWGGHNTKFHITTPYSYDLQRYELEVEIPIQVIRKQDDCECSGTLHIAFQYVEHDGKQLQSQILCDNVRVYHDDAIVKDFSLLVEGVQYASTKKTLEFEAALGDICTQMKSDYYLKCCFTCQYSEYSPYGMDDYGTMLCYCRYKKALLKVHNEDDYFHYLEGRDCDRRQETYLCKEYGERNKSCGYRGFVDGV